MIPELRDLYNETGVLGSVTQVFLQGEALMSTAVGHPSGLSQLLDVPHRGPLCPSQFSISPGLSLNLDGQSSLLCPALPLLPLPRLSPPGHP